MGYIAGTIIDMFGHETTAFGTCVSINFDPPHWNRQLITRPPMNLITRATTALQDTISDERGMAGWFPIVGTDCIYSRTAQSAKCHQDELMIRNNFNNFGASQTFDECVLQCAQSSSCAFVRLSYTGGCTGFKSCDTIETSSSYEIYEVKCNVESIPACPSKWEEYNRHCYHYNHNAKTYEDAEMYCKSMNSHLASIQGTIEQSFLWYLTMGDIWIGLSPHTFDSAESFDSGNPTFTDGVRVGSFQPWVPDADIDESERCVKLLPTNRWDDTDCGNLLSHVCKKRVAQEMYANHFTTMATGKTCDTRWLISQDSDYNDVSLEDCARLCMTTGEVQSQFMKCGGFDFKLTTDSTGECNLYTECHIGYIPILLPETEAFEMHASHCFDYSTEYVGNVVATVTAYTEYECQEKCYFFDGCFFWTYSFDGNNECILKSNDDQKQDRNHRVSGRYDCNVDVMIAAGDGFSCGAFQNDLVKCWGIENITRMMPDPSDPIFFKQLSAGKDNICGLHADQMATGACWSKRSASYSTTFSSAREYFSISLGYYESCIIYESLDPPVTSNGTPEKNTTCIFLAQPSEGPFEKISVGDDFACGLKADSRVRCWGSSWNNNPLSGRIGAPESMEFLEVEAGRYHACGINSTRSIECWADDVEDYGQSSPPTGSFRALAAGEHHTCGILKDRSIQCWGSNAHNQLDAPQGFLFDNIASTTWHTCASTIEGEIMCWGKNDLGETVPDWNPLSTYNVSMDLHPIIDLIQSDISAFLLACSAALYPVECTAFGSANANFNDSEWSIVTFRGPGPAISSAIVQIQQNGLELQGYPSKVYKRTPGTVTKMGFYVIAIGAMLGMYNWDPPYPRSRCLGMCLETPECMWFADMTNACMLFRGPLYGEPPATPDDIMVMTYQGVGNWNKVLLLRQTAPFVFNSMTLDDVYVNETNPSADNYAILGLLEQLRQQDGRFHFRLEWPNVDQINYYEWLQSSNPLWDSTVEGYSPIFTPPFGANWDNGLRYGGETALMLGSETQFAVGASQLSNGTYPAFCSETSEGTIDCQEQTQVELYLLMPRVRIYHVGGYECSESYIARYETELSGQKCSFRCIFHFNDTCEFAQWNPNDGKCILFEKCGPIVPSAETIHEIYQIIPDVDILQLLEDAGIATSTDDVEDTTSTSPTMNPTVSPSNTPSLSVTDAPTVPVKAVYTSDLNEIIVSPLHNDHQSTVCSLHFPTHAHKFGTGAICTAQAGFNQVRVVLSHDASLRPGDRIDYADSFAIVTLPEVYLLPTAAISTSLQCASLVALSSVQNLGIQGTFLFEAVPGGQFSTLSIFLENVSGDISLTLTVTNVAGNSTTAIITVNADIEQPMISLFGMSSSPRTDELRIESRVSSPRDCDSELIYTWYSPSFPDLVGRSDVLIIPPSSRIVGSHFWILNITYESGETFQSEPFHYETTYAQLSLFVVGGIEQEITGPETAITVLIVDPENSGHHLSAAWSNDCSLPPLSCPSVIISSSVKCVWDTSDAIQQPCEIVVHIFDDNRITNATITLTYPDSMSESSLLEMSIVPNLQSDPFKFMGYVPGVDGVSFAWIVDGTNYSTADTITISRDDITPRKEGHLLQLSGSHPTLGSRSAEMTFMFPEIADVMVEVFPSTGTEFETQFQIVLSTLSECLECTFQFYMHTEKESFTISDPVYQKTLQDVRLPAGRLRIEANGVNSSEIIVTPSNNFCDTHLSGARDCVLLLESSQDCSSRVSDCLPYINITSCAQDYLLTMSLMQSILKYPQEFETKHYILTGLEGIIHCLIPDVSQEGLVSKFTDGSTTPTAVVSDSFQILDTLLQATNDCEIYFRIEALLSRLALLEVVHNLPGESVSISTSDTNILSTRQRTSDADLETSVSGFDVTVPADVVTTGRKAFRELYEAYDSLDFTVFTVPERFKSCRDHSAEESLDITLIADGSSEGETLVSYKKSRESGKSPRCVWWDPENEVWSTQGLTLTHESEYDVCSSTHLTVFTIIYDDIDESNQVLWVVVSSLHLVTLAAAMYQLRRLFNLGQLKFLTPAAGSVASVSHSIIATIATLDLLVSILLLVGHTDAWVYILRTLPFCLTVFLYSLVARQWLHIARGSISEDSNQGGTVVAALNIIILLTTLVLTVAALIEMDMEYFGLVGVIFISVLCGILWLIFVVTGIGVMRRVQKMAQISGSKAPPRVIRRLIIAATSISICFAALCVLNALAGADSDWFEQQYALIQGLFLGARITVLWVVIYLHNSIIQKLESSEDEGGVNPFDCIIPKCNVELRRRVDWSLSFSSPRPTPKNGSTAVELQSTDPDVRHGTKQETQGTKTAYE